GEPMLDWKPIFPNSGYHRLSAADSVIALVGDSNADHLISGLAPEVRKDGFGLSHVGFAGCLGLRLKQRLWGPQVGFASCQELAERSLSHFLDDPRVKIIALASRWVSYATGVRDPGHYTSL